MMISTAPKIFSSLFRIKSVQKVCLQKQLWVLNLQQSHSYCSAFTYAIDKFECNIYQDVTRENLTISFSDDKCVSNEAYQGSIYYFLTLQLTNDAIIVTGPEKITMKCRVRKLKSEVFLSRNGFNIFWKGFWHSVILGSNYLKPIKVL